MITFLKLFRESSHKKILSYQLINIRRRNMKLDIKLLLIFIFVISSCKSNLNNCGLADRAGGLVINGVETTRGKWPWLVALFQAVSNKYFCGSTLLSNRHLLTAAHCMQQKFHSEPQRPSEIVAYPGRHDLSKAFERGSQIAYPIKILIYDDWNYDTEKYDADIALIFLENDITFNSYIFPICLGSKANLDGETGTIVRKFYRLS